MRVTAFTRRYSIITLPKIDYRKDYTEDDLARLAFEMPLDSAPGHQWKYSNTG